MVLRRAKMRRVVNLEELVSLLQEANPHIEFVVVPESEMNEMNMLEYASLFCDARGLIGGHGAGLSNMFWLQPVQNASTTVVQIIRKGQTGNVYGALARRLGLDYSDLSSSTRLVSERNGTFQGNYDTVVDIFAAEKFLRPIFSQSPLSHGRVENDSLMNRC